ncbi:hypothetical protein D3C71_1754160 [compost metagenome]
MIITPGVGFLQLNHPLLPGGNLQRLLQRRQQGLQVALQRDVCLTQFAHFRRVDIHVDHFCMRRKRIQFPGHAIVETRADSDQQIALLHRQVGALGTVHAQHTEVIRVSSIRRAQPFQRDNVGHLSHRDKLTQCRYRLRHAYAAADV